MPSRSLVCANELESSLYVIRDMRVGDGIVSCIVEITSVRTDAQSLLLDECGFD
jgi:hypothetical protein